MFARSGKPKGRVRVALVVFLALVVGFFALSSCTTAAADTQPAPAAAAVDGVQQGLKALTDLVKKLTTPDNGPIITVDPEVKAPTEGALNPETGDVMHYANGTGQGQPGPNVVTDGKTYVLVPYDASIGIPGLPGPLGSTPIGDSMVEGAVQMAANANANPRLTCPFQLGGYSQGEMVAQYALLLVDRSLCPSAHLVGSGPPGTPGTGAGIILPNNLVITKVGTLPPIEAPDTAELLVQDGDMWGNFPDVRNLLAVVAKFRSVMDTHYNQTDGYGRFREDETYTVNSRGEIDPNGNITMRVQHTENGLVLLANDVAAALNLPQAPEPVKQVLRDLAPQGKPGVRNVPVTARELVENPTPENLTNFLFGKVDENGHVIPAQAPQLPALPTVEDALAGAGQALQAALAPAPAPAKEIPLVSTPLTQAAAPVINALPEPLKVPVEQMISQIPNTVPQAWTNQVLPPAPNDASSIDTTPAAPVNPAPVDVAAQAAPVVDLVASAAGQAGVPNDTVQLGVQLVNGLLAGVH